MIDRDNTIRVLEARLERNGLEKLERLQIHHPAQPWRGGKGVTFRELEET